MTKPLVSLGRDQINSTPNKSVSQQCKWISHYINGFTIDCALLYAVSIIFSSEAPTCPAAWLPYQKRTKNLLISLWITLEVGLLSMIYYLLYIGWTRTYWNRVYSWGEFSFLQIVTSMFCNFFIEENKGKIERRKKKNNLKMRKRNTLIRVLWKHLPCIFCFKVY